MSYEEAQLCSTVIRNLTAYAGTIYNSVGPGTHLWLVASAKKTDPGL